MSPRESPSTRSALAHATRDVAPPDRDAAEIVLLDLAGGYRDVDGWLVRQGHDPPTPADVWTLIDEHGLIDRPTLDEALLDRGLAPEHVDRWVGDHPRALRSIGSFVARWDGSIGDKGVAVLAVLGREQRLGELDRSRIGVAEHRRDLLLAVSGTVVREGRGQRQQAAVGEDDPYRPPLDLTGVAHPWQPIER